MYDQWITLKYTYRGHNIISSKRFISLTCIMYTFIIHRLIWKYIYDYNCQLMKTPNAHSQNVCILLKSMKWMLIILATWKVRACSALSSCERASQMFLPAKVLLASVDLNSEHILASDQPRAPWLDFHMLPSSSASRSHPAKSHYLILFWWHKRHMYSINK